MNGIHDMGGMHGFGPVDREGHEPGPETEWVRTVLALNRLLRGNGYVNIDEFRYGIERMAPARYLTAPYFERWLETLVTNLIDKGVLTSDELAARAAGLDDAQTTGANQGVAPEAARKARPGVPATPSPRRETDRAPRFNIGDEVRTRNRHPTGHTRLPRYARGKRGVINRVQGVHVFPDTNALGLGEQPQHLYSVQFAGDELWGPDAEPGQYLYLDLFEPYLEPA
ncbi:MAG TPA: nitrile hydratase subunit beta [Nitrolancea sp.]|nr:nitrile hydratase subunit beta [Nitrolancea sp.]